MDAPHMDPAVVVVQQSPPHHAAAPPPQPQPAVQPPPPALHHPAVTTAMLGGNPVGGINTQTFTNQHIFMPPTTLAAMHAAAGMQHAHAQAQQMGQQHQADPRPAPGFASMRPPPQPMQQPQPIQPQQPSQHQQAQVKGKGGIFFTMHLKCSSFRIRDAVNVPYQSSIKMSAPQAPLDLTRQQDINKQQQPQQQGPIEQPPKPTPVEQPKAPAPVAAQPAAVAPPPQQPKPTGYAAIAASNTNAAPGIPSNPTHEPPADSFTSIGEWNQVRYTDTHICSFEVGAPRIVNPLM